MSKSSSEDTEITLGTGKMLGLFFGLVIVCAVFFGMGYTMGKSAVKSAPELLPSPSTTSGTHPPGSKPSSLPASATQEVVQQQSVPLGNTAGASPNSAIGTTQSTPAPATTPDQPAAQPIAGYFVQVAAVSKQEDAEAFIGTSPSDKLYHVEVGPFTDIKDAEAMRAKLVSDGYSPILKK
jgi:cell division protein FtsN